MRRRPRRSPPLHRIPRAREPARGSPRRRGRTRRSPPRTRSRANGSTPLAAIAPNITALTTVPASRASASMSNATSLRLCRRATSSRRVRVVAAVAQRHLLGGRQRAAASRSPTSCAPGSPCRSARCAPLRAARTRRRGRCRPAPGAGSAPVDGPPSAAIGSGQTST